MNKLRTFFFLAVSVAGLIFLLPGQGLTQSSESNKDSLSIGGALRYNILLTDYGGNLTTNDRQFTFDVWRLNVYAQRSGIQMDFEYRFYPTYATHFIHHGWIGTRLGRSTQLKVGVTKVPFGLLPYASNSWWFSTAYYAGFEDDYDIGFTAEYDSAGWNLQAGYFMQSEPNGPATLEYDGIQLANNTARYSYDIVETANETNSERSQFNGRVAYDWQHGGESSIVLGASAEYGRIYNEVLDDFGHHTAVAVHAHGNYGRFDIKAEYLRYDIEARNDQGRSLDQVQMGAYGFGTYPVAAEASMYIGGLAYRVPVEDWFLDSMTIYDDVTVVDKRGRGFHNTVQNVVGISFGIGDVYGYLDVASGQNHPWLNDRYGVGLGRGQAGPRWNTRLNFNIGYYF